MKSCYFLLLLVVMISAACNKTTGIKNKESLQGKWELRGIYGQIGIDYNPGNGNELQFNDGNYIKIKEKVQEKAGKYSVLKDASVQESVGLVIPIGKFENRIVFDDNQDQKIFFQISNDTLSFLQGYFPTDGGANSVYVRVD